MTAPAVAGPAALRATSLSRLIRAVRALVPVWSKPAALRAVRAAVLVPGLFALSSKVIGNAQIATFAAFGGFATLVLASFGGARRDKLEAHIGLALAGSVVLVIGTAVNSTTWLAASVTLVVAFCVLFAGVASANAASGATAVLLAYVLPAASPGNVGAARKAATDAVEQARRELDTQFPGQRTRQFGVSPGPDVVIAAAQDFIATLETGDEGE